MINEGGEVLIYELFLSRLNIHNFFTFQGVKREVSPYLSKQKIKITVSYDPVLPYNISIINAVLGSKHIYASIHDSKYTKLHCYNKWERVINCQFTEQGWRVFNLITQKCTKSAE